jgi:dihydrofolate synthase/folylpolyglutamate synthase
MLATKDAEGFLKNFSGLARRLIAVPIHQDKSLPVEILAAIARRIGIPADCRDGVGPALHLVDRYDLAPPPRILITGSLYLAGEVLAANATVPT